MMMPHTHAMMITWVSVRIGSLRLSSGEETERDGGQIHVDFM